MKLKKLVLFLSILAFAIGGTSPLSAQSEVDLRMVEKIRDEGFHGSQVMDLAWHMTDIYGPRLANSPSYTQAAKWAKNKFEEFGAENVILFPFPGSECMPWECTFSSLTLQAPQFMPLIAYVVPFTRGTNGKLRTGAVIVNTRDIFSEADLNKYEGKLEGKIVLIAPEAPIAPDFTPRAQRISREALSEMAETEVIRKQGEVTIPRAEYDGLLQGKTPKTPLSSEIVNDFFEKEGAVALLAPSRRSVKTGVMGPFDKGIVEIGRMHPVRLGEHKPLTRIMMAAEHYNRVFRLLDRGIEVEMGIEVQATFHEDDIQDYDVIAEIPGTDLKDEVVMLGGHFDGMPAGTGAADNAAGAAMVMEAIRILKAVGVRPRRTIRAALWGSHEIGMYGSKAYIKKTFYDYDTDTHLPAYDKLTAYFNSDYYGRIVGVYMHGNDFVRPIFEAWKAPFEDLAFTTLVAGNSTGSDHMNFIKAGLPAYKWINDTIEYFTTIHHTNMDLYDRLVPEDMMQAAVINACWAYFAAMRDEMLPRSSKQMKNNRRGHTP